MVAQDNCQSVGLTITPRSVTPQVVSGESSDHAAEHTSVSSSNGGMIAKYSELFGSCTFQNCEIKFN